MCHRFKNYDISLNYCNTNKNCKKVNIENCVALSLSFFFGGTQNKKLFKVLAKRNDQRNVGRSLCRLSFLILIIHCLAFLSKVMTISLFQIKILTLLFPRAKHQQFFTQNTDTSTHLNFISKYLACILWRLVQYLRLPCFGL